MDDNYKHPEVEKKIRFRLKLLGSKKENYIWITVITVLSFLLSASMSVAASSILNQVDYIVAFLVVLIIVIINILFDIIGTAVTAAEEVPFHAMASRKTYGATQAIKLIRNADKVSNFCNDVVGDICGVISGSASAYIVIKIASKGITLENTFIELIITGLVASLTVGGKALGKTIAIANSNYIIYKVAVIIKFISVRINWKRKKGKISLK